MFGLRGLMVLLLAGSMLSVQAKPKKKTAENEQVAEDKEAAALKKKLKAKFDYSFNDISDKLVIINCVSAMGRSAGSGFIAKMDGKTYLFTNQHVIMGADKISFKTIDGRTLKPRSVELSKSRDIVRLLLSDCEGFEVVDRALMDVPVAVFGNSEGGGVATELYGMITGVGAELVEVSAKFVSGNSGSPVLDQQKRVVGIASYVRFSSSSEMLKGTRFENSARRFCFRLAGNQWMKVNWKSYNEKYGKTYVTNEQFTTDVIQFFEQWGEGPLDKLNIPHTSPKLATWAKSHNAILWKGGTRKHFKPEAYVRSMDKLSGICAGRAAQIRKLMADRNLTMFLRQESEGHIYLLESVEGGCAYMGTHFR